MKSVDPVERFLKQMATSEAAADVPPSGTIWWRSELRRRMDLEERATRPLRIVEGLACALGAAVAALLAGQMGILGTIHYLIR
jgi:hypothetical protein